MVKRFLAGICNGADTVGYGGSKNIYVGPAGAYVCLFSAEKQSPDVVLIEIRSIYKEQVIKVKVKLELFLVRNTPDLCQIKLKEKLIERKIKFNASFNPAVIR
ncbi:hypothetical protein DINM_003967 [Dirofilaria immitis]|nr:hypothetical protein [Dirofilaria immitis]